MSGKNNILVISGNGKTGRRVVERLKAQNLPVQVGSRSTQPPFDWEQPDTWAAALTNMQSVYVAYQPDLAVPGAVDAIRTLTQIAAEKGVRRLVLLSGRGEEEAQRSEQIVQQSSLEWTFIRASWFAQNFSEGMLLDPILNGEVALPAGDVLEPFIDVEDIADIAAAALTDDRHVGQVYDVTGSRLLTFEQAVAEIAAAAGRDIHYVQVAPEAYASALEDAGVPADYIWLVNYLFATVLDGRNSSLSDGVQRALGREPRDFSDYVREAAASGAWRIPVTI